MKVLVAYCAEFKPNCDYCIEKEKLNEINLCTQHENKAFDDTPVIKSVLWVAMNVMITVTFKWR